MLIPANVILIWTGTNASIPSGWSRETTLDDKYPKGTANATNPNDTGGSNTHSHTSPSHSHTLNSHDHYIETGSETSTNSQDCSDSQTGSVKQSHWHKGAVISTTGGNLDDAITYASVNGEPPYYTVIYIKPTAGYAPLSANIVALWNSSTLPSGWNFCDGNSSTPNLTSRYLKGATTSADAGTTGGSLNHAHTVDHSHTSSSHYHTIRTSWVNEVAIGGGSGSTVPPGNHTHDKSLDATSINGGSYTGTAGSADSVEPSYKKLNPIKNNTGHADMPVGLIGMWLGTLSSIPVGWSLCDGTNGTPDMRDYHIKCSANIYENGSSGGSNTHSHAASNSHTHTATGTHTHTATGNTGGPNEANSHITDAGGYWATYSGHTHPVTRIDSATAVWANQTLTANSSNGEPAYHTVAFIQYKFSAGGAALFDFT